MAAAEGSLAAVSWLSLVLLFAQGSGHSTLMTGTPTALSVWFNTELHSAAVMAFVSAAVCSAVRVVWQDTFKADLAIRRTHQTQTDVHTTFYELPRVCCVFRVVLCFFSLHVYVFRRVC